MSRAMSPEKKAARDHARLLRKLEALAEEARLAAPQPIGRVAFLARVLGDVHRMVTTHDEHRAQTELLYRPDGRAHALVLMFESWTHSESTGGAP